jgi:chromosome partitioning protein
MSPHALAVANHKGGPGKTTLCRELGIYLATQGYEICLIDTDPQANLTKGLTDIEQPGTYEALCGEKPCFEQIREHLALMHGSKKLATLERNLIGEVDAYVRLREILTGDAFQCFDSILIDTPPALGVMTLNALAASEYLAIVVNPSVYTMQGTNMLMETYTKVRDMFNPRLKILGVLLNEVNARPIIVREIIDELVDCFGDMLIDPCLSRSVKIEEAIAARKGVVEMGKSKVATEIADMGQAIIERITGDMPKKEA